MLSQQIHALLIEDDPDDILLLKDCLAETGMGKIKLDSADRLSRGLIQLGSGSYDVVLLDLNLPDSRGLDTLNTTIKRFPKLPVVVLSGLADDVITIEAVRRGAQDYLVKGEINGPLVMRVIRYAIERKQVEAVLRASEARYRTLVETSPNGITLVDLEGNVVLCNQQAARLHGYENPETMIGTHVLKLVVPTDRQLATVNTSKTLNEGKVTNAEYTMLRKDGSQFPAEFSTALIRNTAGIPTGFIGITRDISERKQAILAKNKLGVLKEEFFSSLANELRIPLLRLIHSITALQQKQINLPDAQDQLLPQAALDVQQLLDLVDELQDYSSVESGHLKLNLEKVDISIVIENVLQSLREQADRKRISLTYAPIDRSLVANADQSRLRRVINKLVENAIKYSEMDGNVLITAKSMNETIIINVIDEGRGISANDCARIFDKDYQFDDMMKENPPGLGLGLYVERQIIKAHGGSLTVSSQLHAGSTFTLTIPVNK